MLAWDACLGMLADRCSLVRSRRLFLRPDLAFARQPHASRVKFAACGGTGATRSRRLGASMARTHNLTGLSTAPCFGLDVVACRSVTAISKRRLDRGGGVQIEIDHLLKHRRGGAVTQAFRQGIEPGGTLGLDRDQLGQRIIPAPRPASPHRPRLFDSGRRLPPGAVAGWRCATSRPTGARRRITGRRR